MTDRELMVERIQNAMQALERTHAASDDLRKEVNGENLKAFREHMHELCEHLAELKTAMENQALYGEDELINLFSEWLNGKPSPYRHVAEVEHKK
jgi:hypothetical protein